MKLPQVNKSRVLRVSLASGLFGLVLASASGAPLAPQTSEEQPAAEVDSVESFQLVQERRRDLVHPGNPLDISGVFEGDNDLAAGRGALGRSDFKPVLVNAAEGYERQLAMLENRTRFDTSYTRTRQGNAPRVQAPVRGKGAPDDAPASSSGKSWLAALAVAVAATCALVLQGRK